MKINFAIASGGNTRKSGKHRSYHRGVYSLILLHYFLTYGGYGGLSEKDAPPHAYAHTRIYKRVRNPSYMRTYYYNHRNHRKYLYFSLIVQEIQIDSFPVVAFSTPVNQQVYPRNPRKVADRRQS